MSNTIQGLVPKTRFPRVEMRQLSQMSILRKLPPESASPKTVLPILNFGYLYLRREENDVPSAHSFWIRECDVRKDPEVEMEFPFKEFTSLSKIHRPDDIDQIVHFGLNRLERVDPNAATEFLRGLNDHSRERLKHLRSLTLNPSHSQQIDLKKEIMSHLNHLTNLRHLLESSDETWHYDHLNRYLLILNLKAPNLHDHENLVNLYREISTGKFDRAILEASLGMKDEPVKFWKLS